jgi:hypothetical protein
MLPIPIPFPHHCSHTVHAPIPSAHVPAAPSPFYPPLTPLAILSAHLQVESVTVAQWRALASSWQPRVAFSASETLMISLDKILSRCMSYLCEICLFCSFEILRRFIRNLCCAMQQTTWSHTFRKSSLSASPNHRLKLDTVATRPCSFFIPTKCFMARFLQRHEYLYLGVSNAYRSVTALLGLQVVVNAFDFCEVANQDGCLMSTARE